MIRQKELVEWLESPATHEFLDLVKEHRDASFNAISALVVNTQDIDKELKVINQYKSQVNVFDLVLDIEMFMKERVEAKKNEDIPGIRAEFDREDGSRRN